MENLWSPWRSTYIKSFSNEKEESGCFLCHAVNSPTETDRTNLVVHRSNHCFVIMNRFPYNSGHLMIVPNIHSGDLATLNSETTTDVMSAIQLSLSILNTLYKPQGCNIGANLGRVAGAGVPDHVHFHIVPRWNGDTNFMPVLGEVKVISESLESAWEELHNEFSRITKGL